MKFLPPQSELILMQKINYKKHVSKQLSKYI